MNAIHSKIFRYVIVFFSLIAIYLVIAFVACVIPSDNIRSNIRHTLEKGDMQTNYPKAIINDSRFQMDNFTDALILSQAYYCDRSELKRSMLVVPYASAGPEKKATMTENLRNLAYDKGNVDGQEYPRYWHGSTFIMRFLLLLTDYSTIRIVFYIVSSLLLLLTLLTLKQNTNLFVSVAYLLSLLTVNVFVTQFSIQFIPVLLITLTATILLFRQKTDKRMLFFVTGSLTAFFDLLTTPLMTLGLPLSVMIMSLYLDNRDKENHIYIKTAFVQGLIWTAGYAFTWLSKWCIATLFTDHNVFRDGYEAFLHRSAGLGEFSRTAALTANINMLPLAFILTIIGILLLLSIIRFNRQGLKPALVLLLISAIPYLWYFMAADHSYKHWWFTYRLQAMSILSMILALGCLVDWNALKNIFKHIKMKKLLLTIATMAIIATGCQHKAPQTSGIDTNNFDTTARLQDDFYQYACGGWMKNHPLDAEHSRYGAFDVLAENAQKDLRDIIENVSKNENPKGSIAEKIAMFYNIGMDSVRLQQQGTAPIMPYLEKINNMKTRDDVWDALLEMHRHGGFGLFAVFGEADSDDANMNIAWAYQSGLGLGDRDYYLTDEGNNVNIRKGYVELMGKEFAMTGFDKMCGIEADKLAQMVMDFETRLAKSQNTRIENRNPQATFNRFTVEEASKMAPNINWSSYFEAMGIMDGMKSFNIAQPKYFKELNNVLGDTDIDVFKAYFAWNTINGAATYLSDDFVETHFDFYGRQLSGREQNRPRWKRVTAIVDGSMGEALGQLYVEKYFPAEAKARMETLVQNLITALGQRIDMAQWMTNATKANAHEKLGTILVKIGYPDKWRDYSGLEIKDDSYFANVMRSNEFDMAYMFSKINKPVDRTEWGMTPQTVNAYYNPTTNEICFPAAILQPPFFNMNADEAANYGAIGVVIGHELTHGYDDQGRQYDKDGNLHDWWTEEDAKNFDKNKQVLIEAFNNCIAVDDPELGVIHGNGELTLGENIADNGGLHVSYLAMHNAMAKGQVNKEMMDGFTPEQRFFLAYAAVWASNIRPKAALQLTQMDVHSLGRNRVNVALPQVTEFIEAFDIKEGDGMWLEPEKRVVLW